MCTLRAAEAGRGRERWPGRHQVEKDPAHAHSAAAQEDVDTPSVDTPSANTTHCSRLPVTHDPTLEGTHANALPAPAPLGRVRVPRRHLCWCHSRQRALLC